MPAKTQQANHEKISLGEWWRPWLDNRRREHVGTAKDGSGATSIWCLIVLAAKHLRKREFGTCWEIADPHRQTEARRWSLDFDGMYGGLFRGQKVSRCFKQHWHKNQVWWVRCESWQQVARTCNIRKRSSMNPWQQSHGILFDRLCRGMGRPGRPQRLSSKPKVYTYHISMHR